MNNVGETMLEERMRQLQVVLSTTNNSDYQIESFELSYYEIKIKTALLKYRWKRR
ncbi:hypothetical protein [Gracilibacillus ureilyticus]|uniref:hypothetical protein n=1 Tax=Gracilibacillus ureilyticus TaxID=531814 RepID=UPI0015871263|nr:hypothetical protein [Gracilibacillus ureilyticus]